MSVSEEIKSLISEWGPKLAPLSSELILQRRNSQNRNIKQIVGHLVDSATNNTHRVVHLQYQEIPLVFPNYATLGNNDRWIAIQNYEEENWEQLIQIWKFSMLHFCHVIENVNPEKMEHEWIADPSRKITLKEMVTDFPRHLRLHLDEIGSLMI